MTPHPPRLALWMAERVLPAWEGEDILGDLEEAFGRRVEGGKPWPRIWFWGQVILFAASEVGSRIRDPLGQRRRWESEVRHRHPMRGGRERGGVEMGTLILGLMQAIRRLAREWRFSASMVVILGVGVGAGLVAYSVVDRVLLQPLPYVHPGELGLVRTDLGELHDHPGLAMAEVHDLRSLGDFFAGVEAAQAETTVSVETDGVLSPVQAAVVTPALFELLGVSPVLGRVFGEEDVGRDGGGGVVLSHGYWMRALGGDPSAVGTMLNVNGRATPVLGVMPEGFALHLGRGANITPDVELWLPLVIRPEARSFWGFRTVVRLARGRTFEQANAALASLANAISQEYPDVYGGSPPRIVAHPLRDDLIQEARPAINAALAGVALLLLVAFANAASLMLGRQKAREVDLAVRSALGAGTGRLAASILSEALVLALGAALLGGGLSAAAVGALRRLDPPGVPRWETLGMDWTFLGAAFAFALLAFVASGLYPALRVSAGSSWQALRGGTLSRGVAGAGVRRGLVGVQVALAVVLIFGAMVLARSARALGHVDLGFDPSNTLTVAAPVAAGDEEGRSRIFQTYRDIQQRIAALPGVRSVGAVSQTPLLGYAPTDGYSRPEADTINWGDTMANYFGTFPGYMETLGMDLQQGRFLDDLDIDEARAVAVVDAGLAAGLYPGEDPIGKPIKPGWGLPQLEIVGVIRHPRVMDLRREVRGQIYTPISVFPWLPLRFVVKTEGDPMSLVAAVRSEIAAAGAGRAPYGFRPLDSYVAAAAGPVRFTLLVIFVLAAFTVLLAAFGLFSVIAYLVHQSRRATAIRSAMGATRRQLLRHHLRGGAQILAAALPAGVLLAVSGAKWLQSMVYGISSHDIVSLSVAVGLAGATGLLATYLPARVAAHAEPMETLRAE